MARTSNFAALSSAVINASIGDRWATAHREWDLASVDEDPTANAECVCGQTNLRWLYTIANLQTGSELFPIGSSCIQLFERPDLNQKVTVLERLVKIKRAAQSREKITLTREYFTRAVLKDLHVRGAFTPDKFNHYDPREDYDFLLAMFNKRTTMTASQQRKTSVLLNRKVVRFVSIDERLK
ncbi:hypothetical protein [Tersicoccus sp. Bi-70]|uniref:hypothetical protein n=1 Tax=Tersicoccus sp. Bi-70 TaxID=1897634 RepID=UPI0009781873|nr:hypothetical protein [Tersicoccus sp. Bi-70]OMH32565.1 hypothetical protein BGP79_07105 [Tersicoccus sp. Bi-70]